MSVAHIVNEYQEKAQAQKQDFKQRRHVVWSEARIFVAKAPSCVVTDLGPGEDLAPFVDCLMVGIKKSDHRDFSDYRLAIGSIVEGGRFVPGFWPLMNLDQLRLGNVERDGTFDSLRQLLHAAEDWIQVDKTWNVDRFISRKGGDESRDKAVKHTGKTERERAKGKARPKTG